MGKSVLKEAVDNETGIGKWCNKARDLPLSLVRSSGWSFILYRLGMGPKDVP